MRRNPFSNYNHSMPPPHPRYHDVGGMGAPMMRGLPSGWGIYRNENMWDDSPHVHQTAPRPRTGFPLFPTYETEHYERSGEMRMGGDPPPLHQRQATTGSHHHQPRRGLGGIITYLDAPPVAVSTGGYQMSWVVDATQIREEMLCCICGSILYNPLTLGECGHGCCGRCLNDVETGSPRTECPECNTPIRSLNFNSAISREISDLGARCPGCPFSGTLADVHGHQRSCTASPADTTSTTQVDRNNTAATTTTTSSATANPVRGGASDSDRAIAWLQGHVPSSAFPVPVTPEMRAAAARVTASPEVVEWFATVLGQARLDALPPQVDATSQQPTGSSSSSAD